MEKRLAIALVLCMAYVFFVMPYLAPKPPEKPEEGSTVAEDVEKQDQPITGRTEDVGVDRTEGQEDPEPDEQEASGFERTEAEAKVIEINTDRLRVFLTNAGASVKQVLLKDYFNRVGIDSDGDEAQNPENWLEVVSELESGKRLGLLREDIPENQRMKPDLDEATWKVEERPPSESGKQKVRFSYDDGRGFRYEKTYTFRPGDLYFDLDVQIENLGNESRSGTTDYLLRTGPGIFAEGKTAFSAGPRVAVASREEDEVDVEMVPVEKVNDGGSHVVRGSTSSPLLWSGSINNYFAVVVSPRNSIPFQAVIASALIHENEYQQALEIFQAENGRLPGTVESEALRANLRAGVGCESTFRIAIPEVTQKEIQSFKIFTGPKDPTLINEPAYIEFEPLIEANYTFGTIEKTLLSILRFFEGLTGNWGIAIILLTVLVRAILFPLQRIQSKAMSKYQAAMKKMKPRLDEIQKKYKKNPKKLREEQMKLMRESGAKPPLLGCLIMLIPIPVFIGLFVSLRTSFELRHSPFFGWITDLSQPDQLLALPFKIPLLPGGDFINLLPIMMTIAWVAQHAVTPVPEEPQAQQMHKMMKWMPIIFAFLLYNYASGLSLYMLTSALLGIVQYKFLNIKTPTM